MIKIFLFFLKILVSVKEREINIVCCMKYFLVVLLGGVWRFGLLEGDFLGFDDVIDEIEKILN